MTKKQGFSFLIFLKKKICGVGFVTILSGVSKTLTLSPTLT